MIWISDPPSPGRRNASESRIHLFGSISIDSDEVQPRDRLIDPTDLPTRGILLPRGTGRPSELGSISMIYCHREVRLPSSICPLENMLTYVRSPLQHMSLGEYAEHGSSTHESALGQAPGNRRLAVLWWARYFRYEPVGTREGVAGSGVSGRLIPLGLLSRLDASWASVLFSPPPPGGCPDHHPPWYYQRAVKGRRAGPHRQGEYLAKFCECLLLTAPSGCDSEYLQGGCMSRSGTRVTCCQREACKEKLLRRVGL